MPSLCCHGSRIWAVHALSVKTRNLSLALHPAMLDDLGLLPALLWLVEYQGLDRRCAAEGETAAYRIVQEALTNIARHAGVLEATVYLWVHQSTRVVQSTDRGRGYDPAATGPASYTGGGVGMREHAYCWVGC